MNPAVVLAVIVGCIVLAIVGVGLTGMPHQIDPSQESINMVQPSGWWPSRDSQYAEHVNVPNSVANQNNAEANKLNAQATLVASQAEQTQLQNQFNRQKNDVFTTTLLCMFVVMAVLILGFVLMAGSGQLKNMISSGSDVPGGIPWQE